MTRKILFIFPLLVTLLMLSACVNLKPVPSQTESFTLGPIDMVADGQAVGDSIYIMRPQVPTYQDDTRIGYRLASGEVKNIIGARWAEPLAEGIARATSQYMNGSKFGSVEGYYPWPNTSTQASRLSLNFQRFGATESGEVQVVVRWALKTPEGKTRNGQFVSNALSWELARADTLVAAYNEALEAMAHDILKSLDQN